MPSMEQSSLVRSPKGTNTSRIDCASTNRAEDRNWVVQSPGNTEAIERREAKNRKTTKGLESLRTEEDDQEIRTKSLVGRNKWLHPKKWEGRQHGKIKGIKTNWRQRHLWMMTRLNMIRTPSMDGNIERIKDITIDTRIDWTYKIPRQGLPTLATGFSQMGFPKSFSQ